MATGSNFPVEPLRHAGRTRVGGSFAMAVDQKIRDVLKLSKLRSKLPKSPKVTEIRVEDYVDTSGEDALRIWVILDDSVTDDQLLRGDDIIALKSTIRDRVFKLGVGLWPYVSIARQSELDEDDED
jgi:hypothetical protein